MAQSLVLVVTALIIITIWKDSFDYLLIYSFTIFDHIEP